MSIDLKQIGQHWISESFTWIFDAVFKAQNFASTYEKEKFAQRILPTLHLIIPLSVIFYVFMLIARGVRLLLFYAHFYVFNPYPIEIFFIPAYSILWSLVFAALFMLVDSIHIGIIYGIGTSIALTTLSVFLRLFSPAISEPYPYPIVANILTGFAIGIVFVTAFASGDNQSLAPYRGIIRCLGVGIILIIILRHLENANPRDLWVGLKTYGNSLGLVGCVAVGIALAVAGDIIIDSSRGFDKQRMPIRAMMGGIIFGITFAFVFALTSLSDIFQNNPTDSDNLEMVAILLGFIGSFLVSMKSSTFIRVLLFALGSIIVIYILGGSSTQAIVNVPMLDITSSNTTPLSSVVHYGLLGLALGAAGGSISSSQNWRIVTVICAVALLIDIIGFINIGLAGMFTVAFERGIASGSISGLGAGVITLLLAGATEGKQIDKGLPRGMIFTSVIVIAFWSLGLARFDTSAYTAWQAAITIGIGCLVAYVLFHYQWVSYPLRTLSSVRTSLKSKRSSRKYIIGIVILLIILFFILVFVNLQAAIIIATLIAVPAFLLTALDFLLSRSNRDN